MKKTEKYEKELFEAAQVFDINKIEALVTEQGVDINAYNEYGQTAFSIIVEAYYNEAKCDVESQNPWTDSDGQPFFIP